ncbi:hypothetical protein ACNOYE_25160 [Nannocystaceae bacterium ST9]
MRTRSLLLGLLGLACASCRSGGEDGSDDEAADSEGEPVPTPRFSDPANLSKVVTADRDEPIELGIADARPDLEVEIDGQRFTPTPGGVVDRIAEDRLRLRVEGSLLALLHDVVLVQRDGNESLRSESLTLAVVASEPSALAASVSASLGASDHVGARGSGEQALLGQLSGETLVVRRSVAQGEAWTWSEPIADIELPGIASDVHSWAAIVEADQAWIAWRVASPTGRTAIHARVGEAGEIQTLWRSDEPEGFASLGSHEYASLDAVAWLGRTALVGARVIRDVERATPGDRVLLTRRLDPAGVAFDPQVVFGPGVRDIDSLAPVIDLSGDEPSLMVRLGRALPWSLRLATSGLPELGDEPGPIELADDLRWLGAIDGALGSRHAVWIGEDGLRVGVLRIDRLLDRSQAGELALPGPPSGPPALAVLAGVPTIVIPRGDQPVVVVRSTGAELELAELPELACDELALLVSLAGSRAGSLPIACLSAGELRLGSLTASP